MGSQRKRKRGPGRPPREIPFHTANFRLDRPLWERFEKAVAQEGLSASEVLRQAIMAYLDGEWRRR